MEAGLNPSGKQAGLFSLAILALLVIFTILGGTPEPEQMSAFVIGMLITIGITAVFAVVGWYLLLSPLPEGHKAFEEPIVAGYARHLMAVLQLLGIFNMAVASVWDEIWHAKFGIPFGEDFFWRPHMLMYFGFGVTVLTAMYGLYRVLFHGKGSLKQRFRADKPFGFAILVGAYLLYALPADPTWHAIYGTDISAWSLPHLLLLLLVLMMGFSSISIMRSDKPLEWQMLRPDLGSIWVLVAMLSIFLPYYLIFAVDWYAFHLETLSSLVLSRPEWMLPAILSFMAVFFGMTTLHATRQIGSASALGLLAFALRFGMDQALGSVLDGTTAIWASFPILLALDIVYGIAYLRKKTVPSFAYLILAIMVAVLTGLLPLINRLFLSPRVSFENGLSMLVASFLAALIAAWLAKNSGDYLATSGIAEKATENKGLRLKAVDAAVYAGFAVFILFFILTAVPPLLGS